MTDRTYQEVSRLCHDAGVSAVLTAMQRYCQNRAGLERSEDSESFEHWLDMADMLAQIIEGWNDEKRDRSQETGG